MVLELSQAISKQLIERNKILKNKNKKKLENIFFLLNCKVC